jgi:hypothetical protein
MEGKEFPILTHNLFHILLVGDSDADAKAFETALR